MISLHEDDVYERGPEPQFQQEIEHNCSASGASQPCGDLTVISMMVDSGIITAMAHKTAACCLTTALIDKICEGCIGQHFGVLASLSSKSVVKCPVSMGRRDCIELPFRVVKALYEQAKALGEARP